MNWSDEKYVKLYSRDTLTWLSLPWQARAILPNLLRKLDGAGIMECGTMAPAQAVAMQLQFPLEVVEAGLPALINCGTVEHVDGGLCLPKFVEAQEATKTERAKKRDQRERSRDQRRASFSEAKQEVTAQPIETPMASVPQCPPVSRAVPLQPSPAQPTTIPPPAQPSAAATSSKRRKSADQQTLLAVAPTTPEPDDEPKEPSTPVARLAAWFDDERQTRVEALVADGVLPPGKYPDEPRKWAPSALGVKRWMDAFVAAWAKEGIQPALDAPRAEHLCQLMLERYLDTPHYAGLTRRDGGRDTSEPLPYPWHVTLSDKVWPRLMDDVWRVMFPTEQPAGGVH